MRYMVRVVCSNVCLILLLLLLLLLLPPLLPLLLLLLTHLVLKVVPSLLMKGVVASEVVPDPLLQLGHSILHT